MESKKRTPANGSQKRMLIQFMREHEELQSENFSPNFTKKKVQQLWQNLTEILNSVDNVARKTWVQWRKVWHDQKKKHKK